MPVQIARQLKPEEREILRKREQLAAIRATLAERELELVDFRRRLGAFEGRYLRQVGALYAELDEWKARISELQARLVPSATAQEEAQQAREQARKAYSEAHGAASKTSDLTPSPELKSLFREVAKRIHPDLCRDASDLERRTRFMAEANRAYETADAEALNRILDEFHDGADAVEGEGIGAELIRIIRQISQAVERIAAIEAEMAGLRRSEVALLRAQAEEMESAGRDLLTELAAGVSEQIENAKHKYDALSKQGCDPA
jgi:chromosome segregation ATPase